MTANVLSAAAGVVLSLAFAYIPGLNSWYAKQSKEYKQLIMLGLLVVVAAAAYGIACLGWFAIPLTCDKTGLSQLLQALVAAVIANQSTYSILPQTAGVKEAKREGKYHRGDDL